MSETGERPPPVAVFGEEPVLRARNVTMAYRRGEVEVRRQGSGSTAGEPLSSGTLQFDLLDY